MAAGAHRRGRRLGLAFLCAGVLAAPAAPAAQAAITADEVAGGISNTYFIQVPSGSGGGDFVPCPDGMKTLSGGAYWTDPFDTDEVLSDGVRISASTPDERRWYADGANVSGENRALAITVNCLPARELRQVKTRTFTKTVDEDKTFGKELRCPRNHKVLSGGSFWRDPGPDIGPEPADGNLASIGSSFPTSERSWFFAAYNLPDGLSNRRVLTLSIDCYPGNKLPKYKQDFGGGELQNAGSTLSANCPQDRPAIAAGLQVRRSGSSPRGADARNAVITGLGVHDERWVYGVRATGPEPTIFEARAFCAAD